MAKFTQPGAKQAVEYFEEAIRHDANYALAYSGLADAYIAGIGSDVPQKETRRRAREAATKALSLDPELGEVHATLAGILLHDDWDFAGAEREFKRAIELSPSYAWGHHEYSHLLLMLGRIDESFTESKKLIDLDPLSEMSIGHLGYHYLYARQYDDAIAQLQKDLQLYPNEPGAPYRNLGDAYYQKGMFSEAVEEYLKAHRLGGATSEELSTLRNAFARSGIKGFFQQRVEQVKADRQPEEKAVNLALFYARLGENDQAFEWLEKAYLEHSGFLVHLKEELGFDNLRSDPRFKDLLRRVGFAV
jgi:tetratricopeptide (TPR) repeat protein